MGKYFDKDYNEIDAFSQEEIDAKVADTQKAWEKEKNASASDEVKRLTKERDDAVAERDVEKTAREKKADEYKNANARIKALEAADEERATAEKTKFETARDALYAESTGGDKEYGEKLKEQTDLLIGDRVVTDKDELRKFIAKGHSLAQIELGREVTAFTPSPTDGTPPNPAPKKKEGESSITDAQADAFADAMGMNTSGNVDNLGIE